jgi:hypothetical protein
MRAVLCLLCLAVACGSDPVPGAPDGAGDAPTYYADIKPILDGRCVSCHVPDGIAPFSLVTYEDAYEFRDFVAWAARERVMPPWPPDDDCGDYHGDRSLTDEQIASIETWAAAGAPEGDIGAEGAALAPVEEGLSRVDLALDMPAAYTPQLLPDDYRCFLIDWPLEQTAFVTGFKVTPGRAELVHHAIAFLAQPEDVPSYEQLDAAESGPGYTCFGGPGGRPGGSLGAWAPGGLGTDFPDDTGIRVRPGSKVVLQVHYNTDTSPPAADMTNIEVSHEPAVTREAVFLPFMNPVWLFGPTMSIPANDSDVVHSFAADPTTVLQTLFPGIPIPQNQPLRIHSANLHMHELGTSANLSMLRANGDNECLLDIPRWDFHWQGDYWLRDSTVLQPGDNIRIECHWDNSAANQPAGPDGKPETPRTRGWGFGTGDEMCLGGFYVTAP